MNGAGGQPTASFRDQGDLVVGERALAVRLEAAEAQELLSFAKAWRRVSSQDGVALLKAGGGQAVFAGPDSPITQAVGLGMGGSVESVEIDRLETFFHLRGATAAVAVCPCTDAEFVATLACRGFVPSEFENVLVGRPPRCEGSGEGEASSRGPYETATVVEVDGLRAEEWADMAARGFTGSGAVGRAEVVVGLCLFERPEVRVFGVEHGGDLVAGAALSVHDGLGTLLGAATLPEFRERGAQTALLHRLADEAGAAGCDLMTAGAALGSASHRNLERLGMRVAYTKVMLAKAPAD